MTEAERAAMKMLHDALEELGLLRDDDVGAGCPECREALALLRVQVLDLHERLLNMEYPRRSRPREGGS